MSSIYFYIIISMTMKNIAINKNTYIDQSYKTDNTRRYGNDIRNFEISDVLQEKERFEKIRQGDVKEKEAMIKAHLKFVVSVASAYVSDEVVLDDLIQEGNIGLIKAIDKFDECRGCKFSSFAVRGIQASIIEYITKNKRILKCIHTNKLSRIKKIQDGFIKTHEHIPSYEDIRELYQDRYDEDITCSQIDSLLAYDQNHVSIGL